MISNKSEFPKAEADRYKYSMRPVGVRSASYLTTLSKSLRLRSYDGNVVVHPLSDHEDKPMKVGCLSSTPHILLVSDSILSQTKSVRLSPDHRTIIRCSDFTRSRSLAEIDGINNHYSGLKS
jgi:hypothetical protein